MANITIPKTKISYYMNNRLENTLKNKVKPLLLEKDEDCVIAIDGLEGCGKSTLAFQIGKYIDPTLNLKRVVFNAEEFRNAVLNAKRGQCVIFDEAFTGFSSRSSLSGVNRTLVSLMMQMRQKNLFVIVVLPTFFLLDKYVALWRTKFLIHCYKNKSVKGYFRIYNRSKKKLLFLAGRQTYSYNVKIGKVPILTKFKGRFYGIFALGDKKMEDKYRKQKEKALMESEKNPMSAGQVKYKEQRDAILHLFRKETKKSYQEIEEILLDIDVDISFQQIRNICVKFGDSEKLDLKKEQLKLKRELEEEKKKNIEKTKEEKEIEELDSIEEDKFEEIKGVIRK